jgi:hypothetical protein
MVIVHHKENVETQIEKKFIENLQLVLALNNNALANRFEKLGLRDIIVKAKVTNKGGKGKPDIAAEVTFYHDNSTLSDMDEKRAAVNALWVDTLKELGKLEEDQWNTYHGKNIKLGEGRPGNSYATSQILKVIARPRRGWSDSNAP